MKKLVILYLFYPLLVLGQAPINQTKVDTAQNNTVVRITNSLNQNVKSLTSRIDTLGQQLNKILKPETCTLCQSEIGSLGWLVATPLLIFLLASFYVLSRLRQEGYRLSDALKENYTVDVAQTTEPVTAQLDISKEIRLQGAESSKLAESIPTLPTQVRPQSTSRLVAFFAGISAIIMAISTLTFFFYVYLRTGVEPKFDSLWDIVLGLGIGVVPYAFNRLSAAISPPKSAS